MLANYFCGNTANGYSGSFKALYNNRIGTDGYVICKADITDNPRATTKKNVVAKNGSLR